MCIRDRYKYVVPAVKAAFEKALADAEEVYANADATQEEVDAAYNALQNAIDSLKTNVDKEALKKLVEKAETYDPVSYTHLDVYKRQHHSFL